MNTVSLPNSKEKTWTHHTRWNLAGGISKTPGVQPVPFGQRNWCSTQRISEIFSGKRSITADTNLRWCRLWAYPDESITHKIKGFRGEYHTPLIGPYLWGAWNRSRYISNSFRFGFKTLQEWSCPLWSGLLQGHWSTRTRFLDMPVWRRWWTLLLSSRMEWSWFFWRLPWWNIGSPWKILEYVEGILSGNLEWKKRNSGHWLSANARRHTLMPDAKACKPSSHPAKSLTFYTW